MLTRYRCGHVGRMTTGKVKRFIRVAEIRKQVLEESDKHCPACKNSEGD